MKAPAESIPATPISTIEEADALFGSIAVLECQTAAIAADADEFIAGIREDLEMEIEPLLIEAKALSMQLNSFIFSNPELFARPRSRSTSQGKYGLRKVSALEVSDEQAAIDFAADNGLQITSVKVSLDKDKLKELLSDGWEIPGVEFEVGDVPFHKVDKAFLKTAVKEANGAH